MLDTDKRAIINVFQTYVQTIFPNVQHLRDQVIIDSPSNFDIQASSNFFIRLVVENISELGTPTNLPAVNPTNAKENLGNITPVFNLAFGTYLITNVQLIDLDNSETVELGVSDVMTKLYAHVPSTNLNDVLSPMLPPI
jgi:hypothetical protein